LGKLVINSVQLNDFIKSIPYFHKKYYVDKIVLFGYYLQKKEGYDNFTVEDITECFSKTATPKPKNFTDLFIKIQAVNRIVPEKEGWVLSGLEIDNVEQDELGYLPLLAIKEELKNLLKKIPNINQKFINEIWGCLQVQAWRGSIVLTWILIMECLQKIVLVDHLEKFNEILSETKRYNDTQVDKIEDFEEVRDIDFLRTIRTIGMVTNSQYNILEFRLKERNRYAHPTNLEITDTISIAFIEDLVNNICLKINLKE